MMMMTFEYERVCSGDKRNEKCDFTIMKSKWEDNVNVMIRLSKKWEKLWELEVHDVHKKKYVRKSTMTIVSGSLGVGKSSQKALRNSLAGEEINTCSL